MPRLSLSGPTVRRIYAGLATAAVPALRLWLRYRLAHDKEAPGRLDERRGIDPTPRPPGRLLWLHAASVGETASALPLIPLLLDASPEVNVLFTTGTLTSARLLAQRLEPARRGRVVHRFVPLDVPAWGGRFLDHWRPDAAAFLESELWPNLLAACRARAIPLMLLNARMSDRSFARWQLLPSLMGSLLGDVTCVQARSTVDAERFRALGAAEVIAPGDLKLAAPPLPVDQAALERLRAELAGRPVWLAASTHPGEEALVCEVHRTVAAERPDLLTIIAPRHPERGPDIAVDAAGLTVALRSRGEAPPAGGIWVVDTLGELGLWYRLARVTFVGRSLVPPGGGQNPLEPARLGCAMAVGPHTGNFAEHVTLLREAGALTVVEDAAALTRFVRRMLGDLRVRDEAGQRAVAAVQAGGDVVEHTVDALLRLLAVQREPVFG